MSCTRAAPRFRCSISNFSRSKLSAQASLALIIPDRDRIDSFLLPLMLQAGFGMSAFQSGSVTFIASVGAMAMKSHRRADPAFLRLSPGARL